MPGRRRSTRWVFPEVQLISLAAIGPRAGCSRQLEPVRVAELAQSIRLLGLLHPPLLDRYRRLVSGSHRHAAWRWLHERRELPELMPAGVLPDLDALAEPSVAQEALRAEEAACRSTSPDEVRALARRLQDAGFRSRPGRPRTGERMLLPALQLATGRSRRSLQVILAALPPAPERGEPRALASRADASDRELLELARSGDEDAAIALFLRYRGMMIGFIRRRARLSVEDIDDLLQQIVVRYLGMLRSIHEPRGYFAVAAHWALLHHLRARRREARALLGFAEASDAQAAGRAREPVVPLEGDAESWPLLAALDPRSRMLIRRVVLEDASYRDLSRDTGIPIGSIGPTIRRALVRLRRALEGPRR